MDPISPPPPPAPPGRPFEAVPRRSPKGCGRPLLVGCGVLAVLVGVAAIVFLLKAQDLLSWTMEKLEEQIVAALPEDVTAEERQRLERGFDAAIAKIRAGEIEPPSLTALQRQLQQAAAKAPRKDLTREDVLDLLSALERVGGLLPADDEPGEPPPAEPAPPAAEEPPSGAP